MSHNSRQEIGAYALAINASHTRSAMSRSYVQLLMLQSGGACGLTIKLVTFHNHFIALATIWFLTCEQSSHDVTDGCGILTITHGRHDVPIFPRVTLPFFCVSQPSSCLKGLNKIRALSFQQECTTILLPKSFFIPMYISPIASFLLVNPPMRKT